jgi:DUF4097 and DUF4098 domain-containing protein YvlB
MNQKMNLTVKIVVLGVIAMLFAATMIALSVRNDGPDSTEFQSWGSDKKIERTFSVQDGGLLSIEADCGSITTRGSDSGDLSIRVFARGNDESIKNLRVDFDQQGNTVRVVERASRHYFNIFHYNNLDLQFEVSVPKNFNLHLRTSGGNISVADLNGNAEGETSGGDLQLRNISGSVRLNTSGGNIDAQDLKGECTCVTSGGSIRADAITGTLRFETSGGNIDIGGAEGKLVASTSGGDILASLKSNQGIDLSTSGGNVTVRIPKDTPAEINAETSGGDVSCDIPFNGKIKNGKMNGTINGGGNLIRLGTSGGDILISPVD